MTLNRDLKIKLENQGADFIRFVNISGLTESQNKDYPHAVLFGLHLSPAYLEKVTRTPDYVKNMVRHQSMDEDEFNLKEQRTDQIADGIAAWLREKGYSAYSQSETNIETTGYYNKETRTTPLPHKTIAGLAGLGWIGKHNLLVTREYGSAVSMCLVLTDAPLDTVSQDPLPCQCGKCRICQDACPVDAIKGRTWSPESSRDDLVDVYSCTTCLMCMVLCPWTQQYMRSGKNPHS